MSIFSVLSKPFIWSMHQKIIQDAFKSHVHQKNILHQQIKTGRQTQIGKKYFLKNVNNYDEYKQAVPVVDYENLIPYIEEIFEGKPNVLWQGLPIYFAKTSGTTSGIKYMPITKESIHNHIHTARNALVCYFAITKKTKILNGNLIFLSGSPVLDTSKNVSVGRLSGIINHHVPKYLKTNQLPSLATNCISNWEEKLEKIVDETIHKNMTLISGIPPWVQMYFEKILSKTNQTHIKKVFPNFDLLIHGGVNYKAYEKTLSHYIGANIDYLETYPASEGFIAYQDNVFNEGLLLNTNSGIFFEFIPLDEINNTKPSRMMLCDVKVNVNYVLIINSNAGLWAYNIGDTIKFISTEPYRIVVTGRIKHFISAFGEHVIAEEVDFAMHAAIQKFNCGVKEFSIAPNFLQNGKAHHEWFIEFENSEPLNCLNEIEFFLDTIMCKKNLYYKDLIAGKILQPLKICPIQAQGFRNFMKEVGKLGEQNKVPRLCNNRTVADILIKYKINQI